jgi:hypothetical protein
LLFPQKIAFYVRSKSCFIFNGTYFTKGGKQLGEENNAKKTNNVNIVHTRFENPGRGSMRFFLFLRRRVYKGCENVGERVHLFGVVLHFYLQV